MNIITLGPFLAFLVVLTILPTWKPCFWHRSAKLWALSMACLTALLHACTHSWSSTWTQIEHTAIFEYIPFMLFVGTLYGLSSQISWTLRGSATPRNNMLILLIGSILANILGTIGASLVCIHPFLHLNRHRRHKTHSLMFFIYFIGNIGGSLTPLGDPPLLLGYLNGVPFTWTFIYLGKPWLCMMILGMGLYYVIDRYFWKKESVTPSQNTTLRVENFQGARIFAFLLLITGTFIAISFAFHQNKIMKTVAQYVLLGTTWGWLKIFRPQISWYPVQEMASVFGGLFFTSFPLMQALESGTVFDTTQWSASHIFWSAGVLSAFLDNAPTYMMVFHALGGSSAATHTPHLLQALSMGTVYMGALTYIGNSPNFLIRSIAQEQKLWLPSFGGYLFYSLGILLPLMALSLWLCL